MLQRTTIWIAVACAVPLVATAGWLWYGPYGTGEFQLSPNGRFKAHAMNMTVGALTGRRHQYIEILVIEESSRREAWRIVQRYPAEADVPAYGERGRRFVVWASDSSSVTVPVAGGRELVLPVP